MIIKKMIQDWQQNLTSSDQNELTDQLEQGKVLWMSALEFRLSENEKTFLSPDIIQPKRKNISFDRRSGHTKGINASRAKDTEALTAMMNRFANQATTLVKTLFPNYTNALEVGRTSFRPIEIKLREPLSPRKDDRLLHVDSFASTPTGGKRILRLFSNINPNGVPRCWRLGEDFKNVVDTFIPKIAKPVPFSRTLKQLFKITRSYQSLYDHYMLNLHHTMKADSTYQAKFNKIYDMPAKTTWITYTDRVSHAATSGQYLLEQTFYLPVAAMQSPSESPLKILETKLNCALTK